jgi:hypothetical protein
VVTARGPGADEWKESLREEIGLAAVDAPTPPDQTD